MFVRHDTHLRTRAIRFRVEENASIDEIAEWLALPRTTIYSWLRDHPIDRGARPLLSDAQRRRGATHSARAKAKRDAAYAEGVAMWPELSADPSFREFIALYIAEGSKRSRGTVAICNSDVAVLLVAERWLRRLCTKPIHYGVQHHADQDLDVLRAFWSSHLDVPAADIGFLQKTNSGQLANRRWRCVHGVMTLRCFDTMFRARLEAWIQLMRQEWLDSVRPPTRE